MEQSNQPNNLHSNSLPSQNVCKPEEVPPFRLSTLFLMKLQNYVTATEPPDQSGYLE